MTYVVCFSTWRHWHSPPVSSQPLRPGPLHGSCPSHQYSPVLAEKSAEDASTTPLFDEEFNWTLAREELMIINYFVCVILEVTIMCCSFGGGRVRGVHVLYSSNLCCPVRWRSSVSGRSCEVLVTCEVTCLDPVLWMCWPLLRVIVYWVYSTYAQHCQHVQQHCLYKRDKIYLFIGICQCHSEIYIFYYVEKHKTLKKITKE